jgi:hypothetical protein
VQPAPDAIAQYQGLVHTAGKVGTAIFADGQINGDLPKRGLVGIVYQSMQLEEDCIARI